MEDIKYLASGLDMNINPLDVQESISIHALENGRKQAIENFYDKYMEKALKPITFEGVLRFVIHSKDLEAIVTSKKFDADRKMQLIESIVKSKVGEYPKIMVLEPDKDCINLHIHPDFFCTSEKDDKSFKYTLNATYSIKYTTKYQLSDYKVGDQFEIYSDWNGFVYQLGILGRIELKKDATIRNKNKYKNNIERISLPKEVKHVARLFEPNDVVIRS